MPEKPSGITIYHNPACATSRKVLGLLRDAGTKPLVVEYLKTPPTRAEMQGLLTAMGLTPRQILRRKGGLFSELGLDDPGKTDDQILDALAAHPVLMERPIVVSPRGTAVCRPPGRVEALLT